MQQNRAEFVDRTFCIACGSARLDELATGRFGDEPLRSFIDNDPWGVSPLPYIEDERWVFVRCADCQQMFHKRILSQSWNAVRLSEWMSEAAIRRFSTHSDTPALRFANATRHVQHVLRIASLTRQLRAEQAVCILDFGCGFGDFLAVCTRFGFVCCGVDPSPARREGSLVPVVPRLEDVEQCVSAATGFHAATIFEVLEHLEAPLATLRSLHRLLVPNGLLVLETPDCSNVVSLRNEGDYRKIHPLDHINAFTPETLCQIAVRAGFRPIATPIAHVTVDRTRVIKGEVRRLVGALLPRRTQRYFRKLC